ncbi:putative G-type lectin S-receptor-like serine/threonine-protein kinase SD1-1 RLK-Pelle-DLSV family [Arabidopsis thaliana]|uniref:Receptor-like serine/threonine-protein kinase n=2 Tax=Arabidopsis TaxID=3701 RepID=A0A178UWV5_ARATH|nr:Bulb-type lectin domain [Arabidopsis thaliana x Arabidopsis arenosa]OAO98083.1 hypothetical protein AXX17_AT4G31420 [Arabidopsis thaliana]VYS64086.1 unnamed protein product [Arabidopsis thaliana]
MREIHSLFSLSLFLISSSLSVALDYNVITPKEFLKDGDTLSSPDQVFQLGFFSLDQEEQPQHRFLGLWYMEPFAVVWVANRNNPLYGTSGFLNLSSLGDLQLFDGEHKALWSSSSSSTKASKTANNPLLKISCSGNLISSDGEEAVLWQSFDYPMNTILAGMKLGKNFKTQMEWSLSSWKTLKDPSPGDFTLSLDTRGLPQLILRKNGDSSYSYRLGSWNGLSFTGAPAMGRENSLFDYKFTSSAQEVNYSWTPRHRIVSRLVLNNTGKLHRFIQSKQNQWILANTAPEDECDYYSICGAYAVCGINSKNTPSCSCLQGFKPKSGRKWNISRGAYGCVHEIPTNCEKKDAFVKFPGLKLPDTSWSWYDAKNEMTLEDCKIKCSSNCSCTAYANTDIREGGKGCLLWFGDLVDMREYSSFGQDVYIRMGFAKIEFKGREVVGMVVGSVVAIAVVLVVVFACFRKKIMKRYRGENFRKGIEEEDLDLPIFDRKTISIATGDFSYVNFLGRGGFGPVYKGKLEDGQEIAVKRLSANSGQGVEEFKNEVKLIAKLQHRNLVRLLGCCIQGEECMLIYEYMPNKSLDFFIFDERRSTELDWKKRMNIINGVARGILYLHQDSRLRIIHRDLKAGNVLLDNDMNPKISDFGLAKSFGGDQSESSTNRVVGTYGYMPPEYAIDGHFSVKSDVFSFGVLVLEIITGKTNRGFRHADHDLNLLGHVWKMWVEDREIEVPEEEWLEETSVIPEVLRCIHVALLCVQQKPEDRPTMASVVLMFGSDSSLPHPTQPGFFTNRNVPDISSSLSLRSQNEVSITMLQGR